jgi:site-specific recombinase XerD
VIGPAEAPARSALVLVLGRDRWWALVGSRRGATRDRRLWDDDPRGFGVRIKPSGVATFFVQYTSPITGRQVRHTITQYGRLTLEEARIEARKLLGVVAKGEDPARERRLQRVEAKLKARTVAELCDRYMADAEAGLVTYRGRPKKASTLKIDRGRIARHIKPLIGERLVQDVTPADIEAFFHAVRRGETAATVKTGSRGVARVTGGPVTASRTVDLLGSIFSYAVRGQLRPGNPVARFERPPGSRRDRALSPDEYRRLGEALDALEAEGNNPVVIAAMRVLALTGSRRAEILTLRCAELDAHRQIFRLADTKTGQQLRPIGRAAVEVLEDASRDFAGRRRNSPFLFPAARGSGPLVGVKLFQTAAKRAGLTGVSVHTLRHSYASTALDLGFSELTIAGLLGHRVSSVTS